MIQVYILLGAVMVAFGAGWKVCDWRNDAQQVAVQEAIETARVAFSKENADLGDKLEKKLSNLRIINRTINNEIQKEFHEKPVYLNADCAIPVTGVRLLNTSRGYPVGAATGKPDSTMPETSGARGKANAGGGSATGGN
jgi:hypothetical protein